jgi:hypothetical protein
MLPEALARVPEGALPVVTTTWALSRLPLESRLRFPHRLDEAATDRAVAWVSVEGVGVAPAVPTMGDRRASGHSIIGVAVFRHSVLHAEAVGRCWSRGRLPAWLSAGRLAEPERRQDRIKSPRQPWCTAPRGVRLRCRCFGEGQGMYTFASQQMPAPDSALFDLVWVSAPPRWDGSR